MRKTLDVRILRRRFTGRVRLPATDIVLGSNAAGRCLATAKKQVDEVRVAVVERSEPTASAISGGSLRSTPATHVTN